MTDKEIRILSYVCTVFGLAFEYFGHPWFSLPFLIFAFGGFLWLIIGGFTDHGDGGPLCPS